MGNRSSAWLNETAIGINNLKEVHQKIRVLNLNARIEKQPTVVDETSQSVLKYRTPNFRLVFTVKKLNEVHLKKRNDICSSVFYEKK